MVGLLDVELRRRGCAWSIVEEGLIEVYGPHRGRWPLAALKRRMEVAEKADWPELVEELVLARVDPSGFYASSGPPPGTTTRSGPRSAAGSAPACSAATTPTPRRWPG